MGPSGSQGVPGPTGKEGRPGKKGQTGEPGLKGDLGTKGDRVRQRRHSWFVITAPVYPNCVLAI